MPPRTPSGFFGTGFGTGATMHERTSATKASTLGRAGAPRCRIMSSRLVCLRCPLMLVLPHLTTPSVGADNSPQLPHTLTCALELLLAFARHRDQLGHQVAILRNQRRRPPPPDLPALGASS